MTRISALLAKKNILKSAISATGFIVLLGVILFLFPGEGYFYDSAVPDNNSYLTAKPPPDQSAKESSANINPVRNSRGDLNTPRELPETATRTAEERDIISNGINTDIRSASEGTATIQIGSAKIIAEVARSETAVQKGLSGRKYLSPDRGMLFIFALPDLYRFWMPDMHFPIDIIWIRNGKVAAVNENVLNKFDPFRPVFYTPPLPVKYVLEVNAQFAKNKNIRVGDAVTINYIK